MNDDLKCPRCGTAAQIVDGYNTCGTCKTMDPEQWIRDNQGVAVPIIAVEVKNADGKTVDQVKAEADAAKAIKDKEDEDLFYEELIKKAKGKAPCGHLLLASEINLEVLVSDNVRTKGLTSTVDMLRLVAWKHSFLINSSEFKKTQAKQMAEILEKTLRQIAEVEAE